MFHVFDLVIRPMASEYHKAVAVAALDIRTCIKTEFVLYNKDVQKQFLLPLDVLLIHQRTTGDL